MFGILMLFLSWPDPLVFPRLLDYLLLRTVIIVVFGVAEIL